MLQYVIVELFCRGLQWVVLIPIGSLFWVSWVLLLRLPVLTRTTIKRSNTQGLVSRIVCGNSMTVVLAVESCGESCLNTMTNEGIGR